tara:strand:- start:1 stop:189 length:189 start_codon:yes stop_codon:yes gene_type:complete
LVWDIVAHWGILNMASGEPEIMAPHIPFTTLKVYRANPVTGGETMEGLTKGKRVIKNKYLKN